MADAALNPKDGAELVFVPAGAFQFGLTEAQIASGAERFPGSGPGYLHLMRADRPVILSDYWIYKHPVTVGQYRAFCKATGRYMPDSPAYAKWAAARCRPKKSGRKPPEASTAVCILGAMWPNS